MFSTLYVPVLALGGVICANAPERGRYVCEPKNAPESKNAGLEVQPSFFLVITLEPRVESYNNV